MRLAAQLHGAEAASARPQLWCRAPSVHADYLLKGERKTLWSDVDGLFCIIWKLILFWLTNHVNLSSKLHIQTHNKRTQSEWHIQYFYQRALKGFFTDYCRGWSLALIVEDLLCILVQSTKMYITTLHADTICKVKVKSLYIWDNI